MHVLFVSPAFPLPVNNGNKMRIWSLLRALAAERHDTDLVTLAPPGQVDDSAAGLAGICREVEVIPFALPSMSLSSNYGARLRGLFSALPFGVGRYRCETMQERLATRLRSHHYDAIVCETPFPLINFPAQLPAPLILDEQDVEHVLLQRFLACERNPAKRAYAWTEWRKLCAWERHCCSRTNLTQVCSEDDRAKLLELCPTMQAAVVPNTIDVADYEPAGDPGGSTLVYLGGMNTYPNRNAVEYFASAILPETRERVPQVRFVIVFSPDHAPPGNWQQQIERIPGVEFHPSMNVRAEIAAATVFVVPIRIASGTRFKILEAAAMAKPIVSTRVGAEGLRVADGQEILLADEPAAFAERVAGLLADASRRASLGATARRWVEQNYSFAVLCQSIRQALKLLPGNGNPAGLQPVPALREDRTRA